MRTRVPVLLAVLAAILVAPLERPRTAAAEPSKPALSPNPHGRLDDPFLERLIGDWTIVRKIRGGEERNTMTAAWVLKHQFVQIHMLDVHDPPQYEAQVTIGYDPGTKEYVAHWCDDFGGQYSTMGRGRLEGNAIHFVFTYPDGPFHNTFTWDPAAKGWTFLMESEGKDGTRKLFAEDTVRRK